MIYLQILLIYLHTFKQCHTYLILIKKKEETNDDNKENESDKPLVPPPKLILHNNLIELFNSIQSVTKDAQLIEDIFKLNSALVNTILVNCQNIIHLQLYHGQVVDTRVKLILNL